MKNNKHIVIIETPIFAKSFTQVTTLMTDDELDQAKKERPDLIFKVASEEWGINTDVAAEAVVEETEDMTRGITINGMSLPGNIEDRVIALFKKGV